MGSHCIILASQIIDLKPTMNMIIILVNLIISYILPFVYSHKALKGHFSLYMQCLDSVELIYDI